jgi:hypothetical protein
MSDCASKAVHCSRLSTANVLIALRWPRYLYTLKYAVKAFRERGSGAIAFTSSIASIIPRHMAMTGGVIQNFIP